MAVKASVTITISKYRDTDSITRYYKLQASTAAAPAVPTTLTPSGWSTSEPTYTSGSTNTLYYTDCVVFSDGTFQYTDDGNGKAVKSSSYEAAKEAYNKAQAAQNTINNMEIGGRNLILDSAFPVGTNKWSRTTVDTTVKYMNNNSMRLRLSGSNRLDVPGQYFAPYITGKQLFLTFYIMCPDVSKLTTNIDSWIGFRKEGYIANGAIQRNIPPSELTDNVWKKITITGSNSDPSNIYCTMMIEPHNPDVDIYIACPKLEYGSKGSDWSPAPEDIDENIETVSAYAQNVANDLLTAKGQLTAATTRIDSLQGIIENFVKDDNGMVTVTQTGSGMQIDMTQATNRINQLLTAIESAVTEGEANKLRTELLAAIQAVQSRTAYINATQDAQGRPVITLGATDSPFKVEITNEAINFIQNGQVIAYANGQKFYNLRTVVQQDVQIGIGPGFIWKTRDSGNMGLTWVPAQS